MAEIKSTMDMVMERAARMTASAAVESDSEKTSRQGMRLAAAFLRDDGIDLQKELADQPPTEQQALRQGMADTLLRNIVLPREEDQLATAEKAMQGLLMAGQNDASLTTIFQDLKTVLHRFQEHKTQLRSQLEDAFTQQAQQMEANLAQQTGVSMKIEPSQHPKFQEEWQRLRTDLDSQYGQVLEQHKNLLKQRFS